MSAGDTGAPIPSHIDRPVQSESRIREGERLNEKAVRGSAIMTQSVAEIRAPRGLEKSCKGWHQEAALRMLMNNLDPEVAERPDDLVVYGGTGRAARNWECFHAIVRSLRALENDETLLVQSGKPVGVFRTHAEAPRVLIANANLVGQWANWDQNSPAGCGLLL